MYPGATAVCVSRVQKIHAYNFNTSAYKVYPGSTAVCVSSVHVFKINLEPIKCFQSTAVCVSRVHVFKIHLVPINCIRGLQQYVYPGNMHSR